MSSSANIPADQDDPHRSSTTTPPTNIPRRSKNGSATRPQMAGFHFTPDQSSSWINAGGGLFRASSPTTAASSAASIAFHQAESPAQPSTRLHRHDKPTKTQNHSSGPNPPMTSSTSHPSLLPPNRRNGCTASENHANFGIGTLAYCWRARVDRRSRAGRPSALGNKRSCRMTICSGPGSKSLATATTPLTQFIWPWTTLPLFWPLRASPRR